MEFSRYDNIDSTKWELITIRVSPQMKERLKLSCKLNEIGISNMTRLFWQAWLASEQYDPQPVQAIPRFDWAFNRIKTYFFKNNGNGKY